MLRLAIAGISRGIRRQASNLDMSYEFLFMRGSGDQLAKTRPGDCSLPSPTHYLEGTPTMSSDKQPKEAVIKAYKDAPALTITAGGVTYAYRELGPKGGVPVSSSSTSLPTWTTGTPASSTPSRRTTTSSPSTTAVSAAPPEPFPTASRRWPTMP